VTPAADELLFVPLGGTGEIGMNLSLYGHAGGWLAVDCGITFGGDAFPDLDVMMPDPAFLEARRDGLVGLVLTHAHEDHCGAVPYLWRRLRCPVYATPFTAEVVSRKLARAGLAGELAVNVIAPGSRFAVGPFEVELVTLTHSIPEPNALVLSTPAGRVFHTADWKLDDEPVVGAHYDARRLAALGGERLLAMVCDSTNAVVPGHSGSEGSLFEPLRALVAARAGRVIVTCFGSNIARLHTLARVAEATGRRFAVLGESMRRMVDAARATGYWEDMPALVEPGHVGYLPRGEVLVACTGSQGEPRAALARLARSSHPDLLLEAGDTVVFSSRLIPGNEDSVTRLYAALRAVGAEVVTDADRHVHVSGHPARAELELLYGWVRPPVAVPVHGTPRHLEANAAIAAACHVPRQLVGENGAVYRLAPGPAAIVGRVPTGRLTLADGVLVPLSAARLAAVRDAGR
jgi:ribonuclease J